MVDILSSGLATDEKVIIPTFSSVEEPGRDVVCHVSAMETGSRAETPDPRSGSLGNDSDFKGLAAKALHWIMFMIVNRVCYNLWEGDYFGHPRTDS